MRGQLRPLVVVVMNPSISMRLSLQMIIEADVIHPVEKIIQVEDIRLLLPKNMI